MNPRYSPNDPLRALEQFLKTHLGDFGLGIVVFIFILIVIAIAAWEHESRRRNSVDAESYRHMKENAETEGIDPEELVTTLQRKVAEAEARAEAAERELAALKKMLADTSSDGDMPG